MIAAIPLADVASAATAAGVLVAAWALLLQRGLSRTHFEDEIVRQYRDVIKPQLLHGMIAGVLERFPAAEHERVRQVYLYLDLCNEQVFLRAIGRISSPTWRVQWGAGISGNLEENAAIAEIWQILKIATEDFRELRAFESRGWTDPRQWENVWRRPMVRMGWATLRVPEGVIPPQSAPPPAPETT